MANPFAMPTRAGEKGKRLSLTDRLDRITVDDQQRQVVVRALIEKNKATIGFRHHAPATQNRQNYHLIVYDKYLCMREGKSRTDYTDGEFEEIRFPRDHQVLFERVREFIIFVYQVSTPRSLATGEKIQYRSLSHYRDSLIFWLYKSFRNRGITNQAPTRSDLHHELSEAMRGVMSHTNASRSRVQKKPRLGLVELRQLFDYEMAYNNSIENSEQHQVAWCLARITSCRPGSLCISGKWGRASPLTWRNLTFTRGTEPGMFDVVVDFANIHIKAPEDPESAVRNQGDESLRVTIRSPSAPNLVFSVSHRLLVIALRRGLLNDVTTIDELMTGDLRNITIKEQFLDEAIFFRSQPKGTGIDSSRPLTASALTAYLQSRGRALGYQQDITMYSIRRQAATDMVARIGTEGTRRMMGHAPETFTLERYYMSMGDMFDASATGLNEPIGKGGYSAEMIARFAPLAHNRLKKAQIDKTRGTALWTMSRKLMLADENPPETADPAELKSYRKRMRAAARKALTEEQNKLFNQTLTKDDFAARVGESKASKFADAVLARALEHSRSSDSVSDDDQDDDDQYNHESEWDPDWDTGADQEQEQEPDLEDLARLHAQDSTQDHDSDASASMEMAIDGEMEGEAAGNEAVTDADYGDLASAFMATLMENSMKEQKTWAEREPEEKRCPVCPTDPSPSEDEKMRIWPSDAHLTRHVNGPFHSLYTAFVRTANMRAARARQEGTPSEAAKPFDCTYCEGSGVDDPKRYALIGDLTRHIRSSTEATTNKMHDELKALGGWYDADFEKASDESIKSRRVLGTDNIKKLGYTVGHFKPVIGTQPVVGYPGLIQGSHSAVPAKFNNSLSFGSALTPTARQASALVFGAGDRLTAENLHPDFRKAIVFGNNPQAAVPYGASMPQSSSSLPFGVSGLPARDDPFTEEEMEVDEDDGDDGEWAGEDEDMDDRRFRRF